MQGKKIFSKKSQKEMKREILDVRYKTWWSPENREARSTYASGVLVGNPTPQAWKKRYPEEKENR